MPTPRSPRREYDLPFKPRPVPLGERHGPPRTGSSTWRSHWLSGGRLPAPAPGGEVLSQPGDPFKLVVKEHLPASRRRGRPPGRPRTATRWPSSSSSSRPPACPQRATPSPTSPTSGSSSSGGSIAPPGPRGCRPWSRSPTSTGRSSSRTSSSPPWSAARRGGPVPLRRQDGQAADLRPAARGPGGQVRSPCPTAT